MISERVCAKCGEEKEVLHFSLWCKDCTKGYRDTLVPIITPGRDVPERKPRMVYTFHQRVQSEDYLLLKQEQQGCCAICGKNPDESGGRKLVVDHDHSTGKYRALLCQSCNVGLGMFGDNADCLIKAAEYLCRFRGEDAVKEPFPVEIS